MTTIDVTRQVDDIWERDILPTQRDHVAIPNVSAVFEPQWAELGHMEKADHANRDRDGEQEVGQP